MPTTAYVNAQQFRPTRQLTRAGAAFVTNQLLGPIHAVHVEPAEGNSALRALCGVPVIVTLPVWWPPSPSAGRLCPQCRQLTG